MKKFFIVYGTVLVLAVGFANYRGFKISDSGQPAKWEKQGKSYHK